MQPPDVIRDIQMALVGGDEHLLKRFPNLIKKVIDGRVWEERPDRKGRPFTSFEAFVTHPIVEGLGSSLDEIQFFVRKDEEVAQLVRAEVKELGEHGGAREDGEQVDSINLKTEGGTSQTYALKRLKRDRPDLAEKVVRGEVSPNAAAIEAGFRRKTWTAPHDIPRLADALMRRYTAAELDDLAKRIA